VSLDGRNVHRRRKEIDNAVQHCLDALVLERGATENRHDEAADGGAANGVSDLVVCELDAAEVLLDQRLVVRDGGLDHIMAGLLHRLAIFLGNFSDLELLAKRFIVEDVLLALDDIDVPRERFSRTNRQLDRICVLRKSVLDHPHASIEVRTDTVHLVGEDQTGYAITIGLPPHRLGLRLDASD
jgi:hypothetical protein